MKFKYLLVMFTILSIVLTMSAVGAADVNGTDTDIIGEVNDDLALEADAAQDIVEASSTNQNASFGKVTKTTYMQGEKINVKLLDGSRAPLANKTVKFTINGKTVNSQTNKNGNAALVLDVEKGAYTVKYAFAEKGFNSISGSSNILVITNKTSNIAADPLVAYQSENAFTATLTVDGIPLKGRTVDFTINGKTYSKTTDSNGVASLPIGLKKGNYPITVSYAGETNIDKVSVKSIITAVTNKNLKIVAPALNAYSSNSNVFKATLTVDGLPLEGRSVGLTINGKTYYVNTDSKGVASLPIGLKKGSYPITVSYAGETNVNKASVTSKVIVFTTKTSKIAAPPLVAYLSENSFTATLTVDGIPLEGRTVDFTINGKTYSKTTNSKGVASLPIGLKKGSYPITVAYAGEKNINKASVKSTVLVITTKTSKISAPDYKEYAKSGKDFTATLTVDGIPLEGRKVDFTINGKTYSKTTNSKGVASLPIGLKKGSYPITVYYAGETNINKASVTSKIICITTKASKIVAPALTAYSSDNNAFTATLTVDGFALEGRSIDFTINGKTYTMTTNSKGVASLPIGLKKGSYPITVAYAGEKNINKASVKSTVLVITTKTSKISAPDYKEYAKSGKDFTATLTVDGIPLEGRKVDFTINGKTYSKTTNSKGVASLPIGLNPGSYSITVSYAGEKNINKASTTAKLTVVEKLSKVVTRMTNGNYKHNTAGQFKVKLTDEKGTVLKNYSVTFTVDGKSYTKKTDSSGIATLDIKLKQGTYDVKVSSGNTEKYNGVSKTFSIRVQSLNTVNNGFWLFGRDMNNVNLDTLKSYGTTQIFLNFKAVELYGKSGVESFIQKANNRGISVHIWMQVFYDGEWHNPVKNGKIDEDLINSRISLAKSYASIKGVSGIHMDYLRYPGTAYKYAKGTEAINYFTEQVCKELHGMNPDLIVSAAIMPEPSNDIYYYGQDVPTLTKYLDVIIPMVYKGNYNQGTSWIQKTTQTFVKQSSGAEVWTGLQSYRSDSNPTPLSSSEMFKDADAASIGGATGVILFRWGLVNYIKFNNI